jgi:type IV pilus assembly protein PilY1
MSTTNFRDFRAAALVALALALAAPVGAKTDLSDEPLLALKAVPGNVALALSVEFPTAVSVAHVGDTYVAADTYIGYFDPAKCYTYKFDANEALRHFAPAGLARNHQCTGLKWSGNFLNWATMQTIDPFRWVLTGGYRVVDTDTETILEKATASGQGGVANFPNRVLDRDVTAATGTSLSTFKMRIQGLGNKMRFTQNGDVDSDAAATPFNPNAPIETGKVYEVSVRVKVCDPSEGAGGVEVFNCVKYPKGNFKPEGLIQRFSDKLRLSAFGYLNDPDLARDGGVLRARQKFVGPRQPVPGKADVVNAAREWDEDTGVFRLNPDAEDAANTGRSLGTTISDSGVVNYLNKFGQLGISPLGQTYKTNDPVSEMYYAAVRYFKKQGNVPEWTDPKGKTGNAGRILADGFPVITTFDDPIQFSCQKNFILGIGDVNSHADRNVPGATGGSEPAQPAAVAADTTINAVRATNQLAVLEGLSATLGLTSPYNDCCDNNGALIAGLAYDVHTRDIRSDFADKQTISTFWMDVLEFQKYKNDNQYYLAAKYGGFTVPNGYNPDTNTTPLPNELWHTNNQTLGKNLVPDNYFVAANPDQVVGGLTKAFAAIASQITAFGTAFSVVQPQVASAGTATYSANFDWGLRQGEVTASEVTFSAAGVPTVLTPPRWQFSQKLKIQLSGDNAFSDNRRVVTFNPSAGARGRGVPFRIDSLNAQQRAALDTPFAQGDDSAKFLNYLRGDQTNEQGRSDAPGRIRAYRTRQTLVGDIVGSKVVPVQAPSAPYAEFSNPGYNAFKQANKARPVVVYFGGNDGMLHALRGDLGTGGGEELFAFIPNATFSGPDNTPTVNGLAALGDPAFAAQGKHFFVNATPRVFDVDFNRTPDAQGRTPDWRSVLIGGLGKGGRSYYAIDVTDPLAMTNEATAAAKVLWEFTDPDLGFTFGDPIVAKTAKYGWVVILTSGHNNADGRGYFFFVNPRNGALLEKISTGVGTAASPAGMTQATALVLNRTDGTIDAVYAGDLLGNLWRVDVTRASGAYAATQLAVLTDGNNAGQPVTTRPLIVIQPITNKRFVTVGTGRLLGDSDLGSEQVQAYYAFSDGTASRFNTSRDLPANVSFPLTRANFAANTNPVVGANLAANQLGWFLTLDDRGSDGTASRVVAESAPFFGRVTFASTLPNNVPCQAAGTSRVFSVDVATGRSVLQNEQGTRIASVTLKAAVTELAVLSVSSGGTGGTGVPSTVVGDSTGVVSNFRTEGLGAQPLKRLNWRELPTVQ